MDPVIFGDVKNAVHMQPFTDSFAFVIFIRYFNSWGLLIKYKTAKLLLTNHSASITMS